LDRIDPSFRS